jgi:dihydroorotase
MALSKFDGLELPASADFHVHLRDGNMMKAVVPTIRQGGVNTVYVMPNLVPPLTSASDALAYKTRLQQETPSANIKYLLTLYLHEKISPAAVKGAKAQGVVGIKSYPAGVTTNSSSGVLDYEVSIQVEIFITLELIQILPFWQLLTPPFSLAILSCLPGDGTMWHGA